MCTIWVECCLHYPKRKSFYFVASLSHRSGLHEGDVVVTVNDVNVLEADHVEIIDLMKNGKITQ